MVRPMWELVLIGELRKKGYKDFEIDPRTADDGLGEYNKVRFVAFAKKGEKTVMLDVYVDENKAFKEEGNVLVLDQEGTVVYEY